MKSRQPLGRHCTDYHTHSSSSTHRRYNLMPMDRTEPNRLTRWRGSDALLLCAPSGTAAPSETRVKPMRLGTARSLTHSNARSRTCA